MYPLRQLIIAIWPGQRTLSGKEPLDLSNTNNASPAYTLEPNLAVIKELEAQTPVILQILSDSQSLSRYLIEKSGVGDIVIEVTYEETRTWYLKRVMKRKETVYADACCLVGLLVFSRLAYLTFGRWSKETERWLYCQAVDVKRALEDRNPGLEEREFEEMLWGQENKAWAALLLTFLRPKLTVKQQQHHG